MRPPSFRVLPFPRLLLAAAALLLPASVLADPLAEQIKADLPGLLALYRDLHAHPELSLQEKATSARLATEAKKLGFTVTPGVGGHGVVAVLENGPGPVLLVRTDLDGLPVEEATGLPYSSR
ncbi:hypothetical protein ACN28S_63965 [Cystobacter fuscus]